ncbi:outer membrane lipoprotein-sorting protein [Lacibacter cauensis]|uniref:Outer membrane lipoprotein-sorting protein n=1 Tax=Lacibacter cauensis TaxID=510947 RepID=A0A562SAD7_9BACT|nr:outer membrane lipoprotein carrier protein LolA [Lacibacter cauensis]TWI78269.1 outer membrane lipoprotein-sorting protein [Lacibacter cauensis]
MKTIVTFLISALITVAAVGQTQSLGKSDPAAKKILDAVSAKFKTYKAVQATFTFKSEDGKGKVLGVKKGTLYTKGNKYRVTITGGQDIFCDGVTVSTYDKTANEVTISKFEASANSITPQKLFTNFYDKDFLYKLNGEKKEAGKTLQEIELTPVDKSKSFFKVLVWVDKATQTIYSTRVMEKSGNKYTYTVGTLNGNANITDAQFVFNKAKYPGVEVVDLR